MNNLLKKSKINFSFFQTRLSLRDQALFAKRLGLLVKAGVPILQSIDILNRHTNGKNKKMFEKIYLDVSNGQFLSKSLLQFRNVFGDFAINIIRVGEKSGTLSENLKYLAEELDKKCEMRGKIISALVYPIVILISAMGVSSLMIFYLFPKLMPVFQSLNAELPISTRSLLWLSKFLSQYGAWVLGGLVFAVIAFAISLKYRPVKYAFHSFTLRIPILGAMFRNYHLTNACRTLGLLLKGQMTALEAVGVAADTSTNLLYQNELNNLRIAITKGSNIARHLEKNPRLFPVIHTEMISIGESTGNLSDTLIYLAQICEQELDESNKRLSSMIEPAMMITMGFLVGFIAISIITPIYEITQHLQP